MNPLRVCIGVSLGLLLALTATAGEYKDALKSFQQGDYDAAAASLSAVIEEDPDDLGARYWLGRCRLEQGQFEAAEAQFAAVLAAKRDSTESRLWLGVALARQGRSAEAVPIVVLSHPARESAIRRALAEIDRLPEVTAPTRLVRIEEDF